MTHQPRREVVLGYLAAVFAVTIWAAWITWTHAALELAGPQQAAQLTIIDIGLLRYGAPAVLLAPFWWRGGVWRSLKPPETGWPALAAMLCWGAPFILFGGLGLSATSVSAMATLTPGAMPLFAALFGVAFFAERINLRRGLGLALIGLATLGTIPGLVSAGGQAILGGFWLLLAAASWAAFTHGFRASDMNVLQAAGLVGVWSSLILLVLAAMATAFGQASALPKLEPITLLRQIFQQGVLAGVVSVASFAAAIRFLGPSRAAPLTAFVPPLAAVIGVIVLDETMNGLQWAGVLLAGAGVALANGAASRADAPNT